jgi:hypothetical protein
MQTSMSRSPIAAERRADAENATPAPRAPSIILQDPAGPQPRLDKGQPTAATAVALAFRVPAKGRPLSH